MEFCHFLFFLVKKEHKKDVKCKAFTTTKLELKKINNPRNCTMKNIRFSEKLSSISMFSVFLNSLGIKHTHRNIKGRKKPHAMTNNSAIISQ